jgi:hypothetical protein
MSKQMNKVFLVTAYHEASRKWWKFLVTDTTPLSAARSIEDGYNGLSNVTAEFLIHSPDEISIEL